ncbi:MAG: 50S ribosomal protein L4 [Candidatus Daviesbacteria bacterium]|nr:50S ribosomal protein L4 [Candidatus Daviesbacteria bacterium]
MPIKKSSIVNRQSSIGKTQKVERKTINDKRQTKLSVPVYSLTGRSAGTMVLPKEIFGVKVNNNLLAQAVRVYTTNEKNFTAKTKTRGEVRGSTTKIYKQKGTGRARHGSIRAPIFVGGGIVFGPEPRKVRLELPKKMKKQALISAFSAKMADKEILGLSGLEKATGKTKEVASLMEKIKVKNALIVTGEKINNVTRGVRNLPKINVLPVAQINVYEILRHQFILLSKEAVKQLGDKK